jgi:hypothetical protein
MRQHAKTPACPDGVLGNVDTVDSCAAGVRTQDGVEHAQRRRLASAIRPDQTGDRTVARDE